MKPRITHRRNPTRNRKLFFEGLESRWVMASALGRDSTYLDDPAAADTGLASLETILSPAYLDSVSDTLAGEGEEEGNSPPVAHDQTESVSHGDTVDTNFNAEDADDDDLVYALLTTPLHGTVTLHAPSTAYASISESASCTISADFSTNCDARRRIA
ncbi:MAG: Ig-like domain-containing protein, partial [Planctomycetaceae bacterium]|nr:Ig-like domain-containing protein [Planctomycetaceae bacterium]